MRLHFVVGTGRCGSSLVHEILANHEDAGFISNFDDNLPRLRSLGRFNGMLYRFSKGAFTRKGTLRFAPSEAYRLISREVSPIYQNSCRDLRATDVTPWLKQRFRAFFQTRWRAQGRDMLLHKYTGWSRIGFFAEIFPEARFIHIVRDGRAVANSWLQMDWWGGYRGPEQWLWGPLTAEARSDWEASGRSFVTLAGLSWRSLMESYVVAAANLDPSRYLEVRYEDLVAAPVESMRMMTDFIGLTWSRHMERAVERSEIIASNKRAFERDLTSAQLEQLNEVIDEMLQRYGYS